jgi:hypothetical protein
MANLSGTLDVSCDNEHFTITINRFSSSDIAAQLSGFSNLDWRSLVAHVAIDPDYAGSNFDAALIDKPEHATEFVKGVYSFPRNEVGGAIAVEITDIFGESVILVHECAPQ